MLDRILHYAKAIMAIVVPVLYDVALDVANALQASGDNTIRLVGLVVLTALGVYAVPNREPATEA